MTALLAASSDSYLDTMKALLDGGAVINTRDFKVVCFVLANAPLNVISFIVQTGDTPLTAAINNGHLEAAKMLIEHGADIELGYYVRNLCYRVVANRRMTAHVERHDASDLRRRSRSGPNRP